MKYPRKAEGIGEGQTGFVSRRSLLLGCTLLAISGVALARKPVRRAPMLSEAAFEALVPSQLGEWKSHDSGALVLPPEDELSRKLYEHIMTRVYLDGKGGEVMFLAAYNSVQIGDVQVHRPEVCYRVAGFDILSSTPMQTSFAGAPSLPAREVMTQSRLRPENILYWTRVGQEFPLNWAGQRMAMLEANLGGYYPDGILVRMSSAKPEMKDSMADFQRFGAALWAHSSPTGRKLIFGV